MKKRLRLEFLTLELIEMRRKAQHRPSVGREVEQNIIERHLRELEQLARAELLNIRLSEN